MATRERVLTVYEKCPDMCVVCLFYPVSFEVLWVTKTGISIFWYVI